MGYDAVEFESTRFDGKSRLLSIPHPLAHALLSLCIYEHWDRISYITHNMNSKIRPKLHKDGRLFKMQYGNWEAKTRSRLSNALLNSFVVEADVAQCYPSIYSHSIAWATVGIDVAKRSVGKKFREEWFNQLDNRVMMQKRNETSGVLIGPGTSNIVVELILARVDEELRKAGYVFERYIDDYSAYVADLETAAAFRRSIRAELAKYKLALNESKFAIKELPEPLLPKSLVEISSHRPQSAPIGRYDAISYLDHAVTVSKEYPEANIMKYAVKTILKIGIDESSISDILLYLLMLCYYQPGLLPLLEMLPRRNLRLGISSHQVVMNSMIQHFAKSGRPDGVIWAMHFLIDSKRAMSDKSAKAVIDSQDCLSMTLLYHYGTAVQKSLLVEAAKRIAQEDPYTLDQYWVLLYEVFRGGHIGNPYYQFGRDRTFTIMQNMGVEFLNFNPNI